MSKFKNVHLNSRWTMIFLAGLSSLLLIMLNGAVTRSWHGNAFWRLESFTAWVFTYVPAIVGGVVSTVFSFIEFDSVDEFSLDESAEYLLGVPTACLGFDVALYLINFLLYLPICAFLAAVEEVGFLGLAVICGLFMGGVPSILIIIVY